MERGYEWRGGKDKKVLCVEGASRKGGEKVERNSCPSHRRKKRKKKKRHMLPIGGERRSFITHFEIGREISKDRAFLGVPEKRGRSFR